MIKAIIFDCFGVLVGRGFRETYRIAGGDPIKDEDFIEDSLGQANMGYITHQEFYEQIAGRIGITVEAFQAAVERAEQPNEELLSYIEELHKSYKTAVLSNANRGSLDRRFGQEKLDELFDTVVVSADVGMVKPDPEIYELVASRLGVLPSESVFTDDQEGYCHAAQALGIQTVHYKTFDQFKTELEQILAK